MNTCKNCNEHISGNYCSNCGKPAKLRRIDRNYIFNEIGDFFGANKGLLYTVKEILIKPGESVKKFIAEDRYRFVKPITFAIVTSLIYALVNHFFHIGVEDYYMNDAEIGSTTNLIFTWMLIDYPGYTSLIIGLFMAFWIKLFFRKADYNLFEIFILICFVSGIGSILLSVGTILQGITHLNLLQIANLIAIIYYIWAIGQFFDKKKAMSYIKVFLAFFLGVFTLSFTIVFIGTLVDTLIKP
jgi:hypothetical protein